MKRFKKDKRYLSLLEVLIAFSLVVLCVLPLLYSHITIVKAEKKFTHELVLDHLVNLMYGDVTKLLYKNDIEWKDIEGGTLFPIPDSLLQFEDKPLPYKGFYRFTKNMQKPKKPADFTVYLWTLSFRFWPSHLSESEADQKKLILEYPYDVFIIRNLKLS